MTPHPGDDELEAERAAALDDAAVTVEVVGPGDTMVVLCERSSAADRRELKARLEAAMPGVGVEVFECSTAAVFVYRPPQYEVSPAAEALNGLVAHDGAPRLTHHVERAHTPRRGYLERLGDLGWSSADQHRRSLNGLDRGLATAVRLVGGPANGMLVPVRHEAGSDVPPAEYVLFGPTIMLGGTAAARHEYRRRRTAIGGADGSEWPYDFVGTT